MVHDILTAAGLTLNETYRKTRFPSPPSDKSYVVYMEDIDAEGADLRACIFTHMVTVELYEPYPDDNTERAIEAALNKYVPEWTKQDRIWIESEQLYQVVYEFDYITKEALR